MPIQNAILCVCTLRNIHFLCTGTWLAGEIHTASYIYTAVCTVCVRGWLGEWGLGALVWVGGCYTDPAGVAAVVPL